MSSHDLSTLINSDRVRTSIKRLFTGSMHEILGELFQNSQRAAASQVAISTCETGFVYEDDGHGLLRGLDGFHTLLKIAESCFENETILDQDPMGLGINALLAHEWVHQVTFASDHLQLTIDTARWWTDKDYYSTWFERLETLTQPMAGLQITVAGDGRLGAAITRELNPLTASDRSSPAQGYEDLLRISLDGAAVNTALPHWATPHEVIFTTEYLGCPLTIGYDPDAYRSSAVNWYGQLIKTSTLGNFTYHLHVRQGRPVNPLAPSRRGLIEDAALAALIAFIKDQLFMYLFDAANSKRISAAWVVAYYRIDEQRALNEAPYLVAAPWGPISSTSISSYQDLGQRGTHALFTYDDAPLLLDEYVKVCTCPPHTDAAEPAWHAFEFGLDSFLPMLGEAHSLIAGNRERLKVGLVYWKPGSKRSDEFNEPGEWGISSEGQEPAHWQAVNAQTVFAFDDTSCWDVDAVDFVVGTTDPLAFYYNEAWAGFDPDHDDYPYEELRDSYEESCGVHIRKLVGSAIPREFTLDDIRAHMTDKQARIVSVRYHYPRRQKNKAVSYHPVAITARNSAGERKKLKLIA